MSVKFQHRHYVAVAKLLSEMPEGERDSLIKTLIPMFKSDNRAFDAMRFRSACAGKPINSRDKFSNARHTPESLRINLNKILA